MPAVVPAGMVATIDSSDHDVTASGAPPMVAFPRLPAAAPKPDPLMVIPSVGTAEPYGFDTARICGAAMSTLHATWLICPPGSCTVTPTCVGARSAGTIRPGRASNSAAMVRNSGWKLALR